MSFYFILIILITTLLFAKGETRNYRFNLAFLIIVFFSVFRFDVGYDYPAYYSLLWPDYDKEAIQRMEPLSAYLVKLASYLGGAPFIFILFGLLTYLFIYLGIKKNHYKNWAFFIYLIFSWISSFGELRQALAVSIVFYSYSFIGEKKYIKYLLCCTIASLFHYSAVISFIFYPLYYYGSKYVLLGITIISIILYNIIFSWLAENGFYASHLDNVLESSTGDKMKLFYVFFYILMVCLYLYRKKQINKEVGSGLSIIYVSLLFYFLLDTPMIAQRINYYSIILYSIVVPQIIVKYPQYIRYIILLMLLLFLSLVLYISSINTSRSPIIPYDMIFFQTDSPMFRGF